MSESVRTPRSVPISSSLHHAQLRVPVGGSDLVSESWLHVGPGSVVCDRYVLGRGWNQGSDPMVFEATDTHRERQVWLRVRPTPELPDRRSRHPSCLRWVDQGHLGAWFVGVLDLEGSRALRDERLERTHTETDVVARWVELLTVLDSLHARGWVHGDLTPDAIRIGVDGKVRVLTVTSNSGTLAEDAEADDVRAIAEIMRWLLMGDTADAPLPYDLDVRFRACLTEALDGERHPRTCIDQTARLLRECGHLLESHLDEAFPEDLGSVLQRERATPVPPLPTETWILPVESLAPASERVLAPTNEPSWTTWLAVGLLCVGFTILGLLGITGAASLWALSSPDPRIPTVVALGTSSDVPLVESSAHRVAPRRVVSAPERVPVRFSYDTWRARPSHGFPSFIERAQQSPEVHLTGHTDDRGSESANYAMGLGRAWSVSLLMVASGVEEGRIEIHSAGETEPLASNDTPQGRAANRRVEARIETPLSLSDLLDLNDAP